MSWWSRLSKSSAAKAAAIGIPLVAAAAGAYYIRRRWLRAAAEDEGDAVDSQDDDGAVDASDNESITPIVTPGRVAVDEVRHVTAKSGVACVCVCVTGGPCTRHRPREQMCVPLRWRSACLLCGVFFLISLVWHTLWIINCNRTALLNVVCPLFWLFGCAVWCGCSVLRAPPVFPRPLPLPKPQHPHRHRALLLVPCIRAHMSLTGGLWCKPLRTAGWRSRCSAVLLPWLRRFESLACW